MQNIQELKQFIDNFYSLRDIFYIGFKNRNENEKINWWHKSYYKDEIDYKQLKKLNYYKKDIYLTLNTFKKKDAGRFESNIQDARFLFFDIDYDAENIKNNILNELKDATYIIQTSKDKFQLLYRLDKDYNKNDVKEISKLLSNYFNTDKTFDLARVFRCPYFINNKNNFNVKLLAYNDISYNLDYFKKYIKDKDIKEIEHQKDIIKTTFKAHTTNKIDITIQQYNNISFNSNNKYLKIYNNQVVKANNDKSKADLAFIRYLRYRKININNCIKHLKECRQDLNEKHGQELDYYINNLIIAAADITN